MSQRDAFNRRCPKEVLMLVGTLLLLLAPLPHYHSGVPIFDENNASTIGAKQGPTSPCQSRLSILKGIEISEWLHKEALNKLEVVLLIGMSIIQFSPG